MTTPLRVLSLFSGIGMIDLGLQRAGMTIVGQCEIEPFCLAVLAKHWPNIERCSDVRTLDGSLWRSRADLVCGGFPCQDISVAGKQRGIGEGTRSGLWFEMRRIIAGCRPTWVLAENVPALRTLGADRVLADLGELGYACVPLVVGAWAVGAPHRRDRVWIVARRMGDDDGISLDAIGAVQGREESKPVRDSELADSEGTRCETGWQRTVGAQAEHAGHSRDMHRWPAGPRSPQHEWEEPRLLAHSEKLHGNAGTGEPGREVPEPRDNRGEDGKQEITSQLPLGSPVDGDAARLVRLAKRHNRESLKAYGNSAVPQVVEAIGRAIIHAHSQGRQP